MGLEKKTTEQINTMYEMNNYSEPDISKDEWVSVSKLQNRIIELGSQGKSLMDLYDELRDKDVKN